MRGAAGGLLHEGRSAGAWQIDASDTATRRDFPSWKAFWRRFGRPPRSEVDDAGKCRNAASIGPPKRIVREIDKKKRAACFCTCKLPGAAVAGRPMSDMNCDRAVPSPAPGQRRHAMHSAPTRYRDLIGDKTGVPGMTTAKGTCLRHETLEDPFRRRGPDPRHNRDDPAQT